MILFYFGLGIIAVKTPELTVIYTMLHTTYGIPEAWIQAEFSLSQGNLSFASKFFHLIGWHPPTLWRVIIFM